MKMFVVVILFSASASLLAADYTPKVPLDITFSVYLDMPVSGDSVTKNSFVKGGVYRTFGVFCEKSLQHCNLSVYEISDEYCKGKSSPPSQDASGFGFNYYPDMALRHLHSEVSFEFEDFVLYGATRNEITATIAPKPNTYGLETMVTHADGLASALHTSQGVPLQSRYQQLEARVLCSLGFFPPGK